jgi:uncharacterized protein (DUF2062 family)
MRNKLRELWKIKKNRKRGIHKNKRDFQLRIAEWIYPSIGLKAWAKYLALYLKRKPLSSHKIALGFAFGTFVSFTPFMGLHGFVAIILAYLFKASIPASILGTIVGNPWTFPLIWVWSLNFGNFIMHGTQATHDVSSFTFSLENIISEFAFYWEHFLFPMTIGGVPTGILAGLVAYLTLKYQIDKFRKIRKALLHNRKVELRAKKIQKIKDLKDKIVNKKESN